MRGRRQDRVGQRLALGIIALEFDAEARIDGRVDRLVERGQRRGGVDEAPGRCCRTAMVGVLGVDHQEGARPGPGDCRRFGHDVHAGRQQRAHLGRVERSRKHAGVEPVPALLEVLSPRDQMVCAVERHAGLAERPGDRLAQPAREPVCHDARRRHVSSEVPRIVRAPTDQVLLAVEEDLRAKLGAVLGGDDQRVVVENHAARSDARAHHVECRMANRVPDHQEVVGAKGHVDVARAVL